MEKKEIEIEWEGKKEKVVLRRLTWGEKNELMKQVLGKIKISGGKMPEIEIDIVKWRELVTLYSIESAPFEKTLENLRKLPADVGEKLYRAAEELNPFLFV